MSVTTLGGSGGGSYNDAEVRGLISQNAAAIAGKQDFIADGDLAVAKANGMQTTLNVPQNGVLNNQTVILGKQDTIQAGDLTISQVAALQTTLTAKATTTALANALALKPDTIQDDDLTVSEVATFQTTLRGKATTTTLTSGLATKQATLGWRGSALANYLPGTQISFPNTSVQTGISAGDISVVCTPSIADVESGALATQLAVSAPQSTTYTKAEVDAADALLAPPPTTYTKT